MWELRGLGLGAGFGAVRGGRLGRADSAGAATVEGAGVGLLRGVGMGGTAREGEGRVRSTAVLPM